MKTITLNIGLNRRDGGANSEHATILALPITKAGTDWQTRLECGEWNGTPEQTLVCHLEITDETALAELRSAIAAVSERLDQETIAAVIDGAGELIPACGYAFDSQFFKPW